MENEGDTKRLEIQKRKEEVDRLREMLLKKKESALAMRQQRRENRALPPTPSTGEQTKSPTPPTPTPIPTATNADTENKEREKNAEEENKQTRKVQPAVAEKSNEQEKKNEQRQNGKDDEENLRLQVEELREMVEMKEKRIQMRRSWRQSVLVMEKLSDELDLVNSPRLCSSLPHVPLPLLSPSIPSISDSWKLIPSQPVQQVADGCQPQCGVLSELDCPERGCAQTGNRRG